MSTNEILPFATASGANVLTQAEYQALADRLSGMGAGLLPAAKLNKILRQSSVVSAALAQVVADTLGVDVLDDGDVAALAAKLTQAFQATSVSSTAFGSEKFTASAGQTALVLTSHTYVPGASQINVYLNGVRLDTTDYTETNATTVTLASPAVAGEEYVVLVGNPIGSVINALAAADGVLMVGNAVDKRDLASTAAGKGAELVGFKNTSTNSQARSAYLKLSEYLSIEDLGASGSGGDDSDAWDKLQVDGQNREVFFPKGVSGITRPVRFPTGCRIRSEGVGSVLRALPGLSSATIPTIAANIYSPALAKVPMLYNASAIQWWSMNGLYLDGNGQDVYGLWLHENFYGSLRDVYILNTLNRPYTNIRGQSITHDEFVCYGCGDATHDGGVITYDNTNLVFNGGGFERLACAWSFDQRQPGIFNKGGAHFNDVWFESDSTHRPSAGFLRVAGRRVRGSIHAAFDTAATSEQSLAYNGGSDSRTIDGITMGVSPAIDARMEVNNVTGGMYMSAASDAKYNRTRGFYSVAKVTDNNGTNQWDVNASLASPVRHVNTRFQVRGPLSISATDFVADFDWGGGTAPIIRFLKSNGNTLDLNSGKMRWTAALGHELVATAGNISFSAASAYSFANAGGASGYLHPVYFGVYAVWVDSTGKFRIKSSAPTSDTDGTVIGTQT